MIQPAAPSPASVLSPAIDPASAMAGDSAGTADFGAFLAQCCDGAVTAQAANAMPAVGEVAADPALALASEAATTGKDLPPPLPLALPEALPEAVPARPLQPTTELAADKPLAELAEPAPTAPLVHAHKPHGDFRGPKTQRSKTEPQAVERAVEVLAANPVAQTAQPIAAPQAQTDAPAVAPLAQTPGAGEAVPATQPAEQPAQTASAIPAAVAALPIPARPVAATTARRTEVASYQAVQEVQDTPAQPRPITQVRLDVVAQEVAGQTKPIEAILPAPRSAKAEPQAETLAVPSMLQPQQQSVQPQAPAPLPMTRPHDFSALIDRLTAAREAVAPQAVTMSMPHADFGQVQLHFRHEDGALAVSLASTDPDFARIAAQAAPPVLPVGDARAATTSDNQSAPRGDAQASGQSQSGGQRGQQAERRGDAPQRGHQQQHSHAGANKSGQRSGIFA